MTWNRLLAGLFVAVALAACATSTPYQPALRPGAAGFSEIRIETDRWRVTFKGLGEPGAVAAQALRRAAEITLNQGRDWFIVDARSEDRQSTGPRTSISIGAGGFSGGRTSVGLGGAVGIPIGGAAGSAVAILDIRLGSGAKPADPQAYDARSVLANLAPSR